MKPKEQIPLSYREAVEIYKVLELLVVSIDQIASYYSDEDETEFERELARFVVEWRVFRRLAHARRILSEQLADIAGGDTEDLARACQDVPYWERPDSRPNDLEQVILPEFMLEIFHLGYGRYALAEGSTLDDFRAAFADSFEERPAPDEIGVLMRERILESYGVDISALPDQRLTTVIRAVLEAED